MTKKEKRQLDRAELALAAAALAAMVAAVALTFSAGCTGIPDVFEPSGERPEYIETVVSALTNHLAQASASLENPLAQAEAAGGYGPAAGTDAVSFGQLDWRWGGFNGKDAAPVGGCEIADLAIGKDKMSYRWAQGGCELLGATSRSDYSHTLACLFVRGADGSWRGGKFDWISTSRTSRDFENIGDGYGGWPRDAIETAQGFAFVIVSADGRKRTNVITAGR